MEKNPNNPDCTCDELDGDILDEDGYTCYSCYKGGFDKAGEPIMTIVIPTIYVGYLTGWIGQFLEDFNFDEMSRESFETLYNQLSEGM
jgi:hypothetical protein